MLQAVNPGSGLEEEGGHDRPHQAPFPAARRVKHSGLRVFPSQCSPCTSSYARRLPQRRRRRPCSPLLLPSQANPELPAPVLQLGLCSRSAVLPGKAQGGSGPRRPSRCADRAAHGSVSPAAPSPSSDALGPLYSLALAACGVV